MPNSQSSQSEMSSTVICMLFTLSGIQLGNGRKPSTVAKLEII